MARQKNVPKRIKPQLQRLVAKRSKTAPLFGGVKRPRKFHPGTVALRQIRHYQKTTDRCIPKLSLARLVKEILQTDFNKSDFRFQSAGLEILHEAAEDYITSLFEDVQLAAIHANRITIQKKDMHVVGILRRHFVDPAYKSAYSVTSNYSEHYSKSLTRNK